MSKRNFCEDERIISAFLTNYRAIDICRETALSRTTVYRLRKNPDFQAVIRERKDALVQAAVNRMQGYLLKDADVLQQIIENPKTKAQIKVNAIQVLMSQLREWMTVADITKRLEALENASGNASGTF